MPTILLTTFNARYIHPALGLRSLYANLGELRAEAALVEFTLALPIATAAERLLAQAPRIIGIGVYIWNVRESAALVAELRQRAPEVSLVLGGPEVSFEQGEQPICQAADYVIAGQAEYAFAQLCRQLLAGERPTERFITAPPPPLADLALPYDDYSDQDLAERLTYVEASRGCPFKCDFCLSALDRSSTPFDLDRFLTAMERLLARGARRFKFVDRTFNLAPATARRILEFFLDRRVPGLFLHFEVVPDRLPSALREPLARFPPGSLQLEVGIQSFNPQVQQHIRRRQDDSATQANLRWLRRHTHAHLHTDLIIGLPGEDLASFAAGFDRLWQLDPQEIQVGILKRLRGAPIARHCQPFELSFDPEPPYPIRSSAQIDAATMTRLAHFARYWELVANSGRFPRTLRRLLGDTPCAHFLAFSDWLYAHTARTHRLSPHQLAEGLWDYLSAQGQPAEAVAADLLADHATIADRHLSPRLKALRREGGAASAGV